MLATAACCLPLTDETTMSKSEKRANSIKSASSKPRAKSPATTELLSPTARRIHKQSTEYKVSKSTKNSAPSTKKPSTTKATAKATTKPITAKVPDKVMKTLADREKAAKQLSVSVQNGKIVKGDGKNAAVLSDDKFSSEVKKAIKSSAAKGNLNKKGKPKAIGADACRMPPAKPLTRPAHRPVGGGISMTDEHMMTICTRIGSGEAVYRILLDDDLPSEWTFFQAVAKNPEWAKVYSMALQIRAERYIDETTELSDASAKDPDEVPGLKLRVNTRQWIASRLLPKKYGDRVVLAGDGENPLITQLVLGAEALVSKIKGEKK